jgi:hypothetical protein
MTPCSRDAGKPFNKATLAPKDSARRCCSTVSTMKTWRTAGLRWEMTSRRRHIPGSAASKSTTTREGWQSRRSFSAAVASSTTNVCVKGIADMSSRRLSRSGPGLATSIAHAHASIFPLGAFQMRLSLPNRVRTGGAQRVQQLALGLHHTRRYASTWMGSEQREKGGMPLRTTAALRAALPT